MPCNVVTKLLGFTLTISRDRLSTATTLPKRRDTFLMLMKGASVNGGKLLLTIVGKAVPRRTCAAARQHRQTAEICWCFAGVSCQP